MSGSQLLGLCVPFIEDDTFLTFEETMVITTLTDLIGRFADHELKEKVTAIQEDMKDTQTTAEQRRRLIDALKTMFRDPKLMVEYYYDTASSTVYNMIQDLNPKLASKIFDLRYSMKSRTNIDLRLVAKSAQQENREFIAWLYVNGKRFVITLNMSDLFSCAPAKLLSSKSGLFIPPKDPQTRKVLQRAALQIDRVRSVQMISNPGLCKQFLIHPSFQVNLESGKCVSWRESGIVLNGHLTEACHPPSKEVLSVLLEKVDKTYGRASLLLVVFLFAYIAGLLQKNVQHQVQTLSIIISGLTNTFKSTLAGIVVGAIGGDRVTEMTTPGEASQKLNNFAVLFEDIGKSGSGAKFTLKDLCAIIFSISNRTDVGSGLIATVNANQLAKLATVDPDFALESRLLEIFWENDVSPSAAYMEPLTHQEQSSCILALSTLRFDKEQLCQISKQLPLMPERKRNAIALNTMLSQAILIDHCSWVNVAEVSEFLEKYILQPLKKREEAISVPSAPLHAENPNLPKLVQYVSDHFKELEKGHVGNTVWVPLSNVLTSSAGKTIADFSGYLQNRKIIPTGENKKRSVGKGRPTVFLIDLDVLNQVGQVGQVGQAGQVDQVGQAGQAGHKKRRLNHSILEWN